MPRYFIEIAYNGADFHGWQKQPNAPSVQETIETCLFKLFGQKEIPIVGCGRTDAGVHAKQYFFHLDLEQPLDETQFVYKLNRMFPKGIAAYSMREVSPELHARFDATKRTYRYFIHPHKNPFREDISWYFPYPLDLDKMNEAAKLLLGEKDFGSFAKAHTDVKTNICKVYAAQWLIDENGFYFEISANRFLRNMVRAIVGTLIDIGTGKLGLSDIPKILAAKNRQEASLSVPGHALFLWKIDY
jgi:tRNA pseudouridine38-40 synthase